MSKRLDEISARKEVLRGRCALDRLETRAAWLQLRSASPLKQATRSLIGLRSVRGPLLQLGAVALGSRHMPWIVRWGAVGLVAWKVWQIFSALRSESSPSAGVRAD